MDHDTPLPKPGDLWNHVGGPDEVGFVVGGIRGLYIPMMGGIVRLIPNTTHAIASAQQSLRWSQAAWQN